MQPGNQASAAKWRCEKQSDKGYGGNTVRASAKSSASSQPLTGVHLGKLIDGGAKDAHQRCSRAVGWGWGAGGGVGQARRQRATAALPRLWRQREGPRRAGPGGLPQREIKEKEACAPQRLGCSCLRGGWAHRSVRRRAPTGDVHGRGLQVVRLEEQGAPRKVERQLRRVQAQRQRAAARLPHAVRRHAHGRVQHGPHLQEGG